MRELVASPADREARKAFETLAVHDPQFIARFLAEWVPSGDSEPVRSLGYGMGSFFAWRCPRDRPLYLRMLTRAKDPYIQVAGAIYLSFEDPNEGTRALRRLERLPGDPGTWAALNLARRGDKTAARRALEAFQTHGTYMANLHRSLQSRILVLLSNSAMRSHVAQPGRWFRGMFLSEDTDQVPIYNHYLEWWRTNESKLTLFDPWLKVLERQKVE